MNDVITYELKAYVNGERVYNQLYQDTADLQADLDQAEIAVGNSIQLEDITLDDLVEEE